jgi:predicted alpha-1,6-mannanase (GH76 family)
VFKAGIVPILLVLTICIFSTGVNARCEEGANAKIATTAAAGSSDSADYAQNARLAVAVLQRWYSQRSGLYSSPAGWWNAANSITVLANFARITGDSTYNPVFSETFASAQKSHANFINSYYDDQQWWALAWVDAYDLTGNPAYLAMAKTIFSNVEANGWDTTTCHGGVWWNTSKAYKNAITNELFLSLAAELANRTSGTESEEYQSWAQKEWLWFKASGMINSKDLINDGLNSTNPSACTNNGGTTWTYNQGVILGGLVELYKADQDPALLPQAEAIANAALVDLSVNGILTEPKRLSGTDGPQFKGIFMRNLMALYDDIPTTSGLAQQYRKFADANAQSIWTRNRSADNALGGMWQGPFDSGDATRQTSALDALNAAADMR